MKRTSLVTSDEMQFSITYGARMSGGQTSVMTLNNVWHHVMHVYVTQSPLVAFTQLVSSPAPDHGTTCKLTALLMYYQVKKSLPPSWSSLMCSLASFFFEQ